MSCLNTLLGNINYRNKQLECSLVNQMNDTSKFIPTVGQDKSVFHLESVMTP